MKNLKMDNRQKRELVEEYWELEYNLLHYLNNNWIDSLEKNGIEKNNIVTERIIEGFAEKRMIDIVLYYKELSKNEKTFKNYLDNLRKICYTIYAIEK